MGENNVVRRSARARARAAAVFAAVALLVGVSAGFGSGTAAADPTPSPKPPSNGSWWVQPAPKPGAAADTRQYFILEGRPGTTLQDGLAVSNYTDHPITYYVYGADGYNTPRDGQFALRDHGFAMTGVGAWVRTAFPTVTVPARTSTVVPISIAIPSDASPGDHVGGVSGMDTAVESVQQQGNVQVGIKRVVAARLYVHVDGPAVGGLTVTDLKVAGSASFPAYVSDSDGTVTATVTNSGNLLESPKAHLHATGIFGTLIDRTVQLPQILPGQSIDFSQVWKNLPPFEIGTLHLDVTDGTASPPVTSTAAVSVTLIPWLSLLVVAGVVLAVLAVLVFWRRRGIPLPARPRREPSKAAAP
ncbi:hypothetical protein ABH926_001938 [Catenulispora sp. GP43]